MSLILRGGRVFYRGSLIRADVRLEASDSNSLMDSTEPARHIAGTESAKNTDFVSFASRSSAPTPSTDTNVHATNTHTTQPQHSRAHPLRPAATLTGGIAVPGTKIRLGTAQNPLHIKQIGESLPSHLGDVEVDVRGKLILPGFADIHVHLREPGFSYKETIHTGTAAAARGGFTAVGAMPNVSPPPDQLAEVLEQQRIYEQNGLVQTFQYACLTRGGTGQAVGQAALLDYAALAPQVIGFSDDGFGIQDGDTARLVMGEIAKLGAIVAAHAEDLHLSADGYINDGGYAHRRGHKGKPKSSEWTQLQRDLEIVADTGCPYHACHISCLESVELIHRAKAQGLPVTCESAPHYLALWDDLLQEDGRFRMNPPIRAKADREALVQALLDGTIDMVATDHAPHSAEEKAGGLATSANGVVGLENSASVIWSTFVATNLISVADFVRLLSTAPRQRFNLGGGQIVAGADADLVIFDPDFAEPLDTSKFLSKGKATPFAGELLQGRVDATICQGVLAWDEAGVFGHSSAAKLSE